MWLTDIKMSLKELDSTQLHVAAGVGALAVGGLMLRLFLRPSRSRNYVDPTSVGKEYDQWNSDGVLERFWGEHIHHGWFGEDGKDQTPSIKAKEILIEKLVEFAKFKSLLGDKKPIKVLDIGCGIGGSSRFIAKWLISQGVKVETYGVTLSDQQVDRARELSKQQGLENNCFFQKADALALPFDAADFDIVWSLESGEHMPDKTKFVSEAYRVLKPGGRLLLATWCTKEEKELTPKEVSSLEIIYREWALPFFVSMQEYERIFAGLSIPASQIESANWSTQTWRTWTMAVWDGAVAMHWLLLRGPFVFFRTLKDVYAIYHMIRGFKQGYVVYGVFTLSK